MVTTNSCKKKLDAIKKYLSVWHLMAIDFQNVELKEPTSILWSDNTGNIHDDRVIGIMYDGKELSLKIHAYETNTIITLYEDDFALNLDWLTNIYENLKEVIHSRSEKLRARNPIQSQRASKFLKNAGSFCEEGGYSENTLLQTVVLAEFECTEKANANIAKLVDEIVNLQHQVHQNSIPSINLGQYKPAYYRKLKADLLKQYQLTSYESH